MSPHAFALAVASRLPMRAEPERNAHTDEIRELHEVMGLELHESWRLQFGPDMCVSVSPGAAGFWCWGVACPAGSASGDGTDPGEVATAIVRAVARLERGERPDEFAEREAANVAAWKRFASDPSAVNAAAILDGVA